MVVELNIGIGSVIAINVRMYVVECKFRPAYLSAICVCVSYTIPCIDLSDEVKYIAYSCYLR